MKSQKKINDYRTKEEVNTLVSKNLRLPTSQDLKLIAFKSTSISFFNNTVGNLHLGIFKLK